jgi:hypothetical protein
MKLMFAKWQAWLCLCLLVSLCCASCTVKHITAAGFGSKAEPGYWVVKAVFQTGYYPYGIRVYNLPANDDMETIRAEYNLCGRGPIVVGYYCRDKDQCMQLVQQLSELGAVEIISIKNASE